VDGRAKSIWDDFSKQPGKTQDGRNGDIATDSYRLWKDDIALLVKYGVKSYRFSISWPRIIPLGGRNDPINPKGIQWYSNFIDALLDNGIVPFVVSMLAFSVICSPIYLSIDAVPLGPSSGLARAVQWLVEQGRNCPGLRPIR
jgi:beta-glucosidase/6-phospho-beta-glucosidase/beta-galactosidase